MIMIYFSLIFSAILIVAYLIEQKKLKKRKHRNFLKEQIEKEEREIIKSKFPAQKSVVDEVNEIINNQLKKKVYDTRPNRNKIWLRVKRGNKIYFKKGYYTYGNKFPLQRDKLDVIQPTSI